MPVSMRMTIPISCTVISAVSTPIVMLVVRVSAWVMRVRVVPAVEAFVQAEDGSDLILLVDRHSAHHARFSRPSTATITLINPAAVARAGLVRVYRRSRPRSDIARSGAFAVLPSTLPTTSAATFWVVLSNVGPPTAFAGLVGDFRGAVDSDEAFPVERRNRLDQQPTKGMNQETRPT